MFHFESRIRYSEVDATGHLSLYSILNYFQDCSTFQAEDLGIGFSYLREHKRVWLMSAWQIVINRYPALGEQISTCTWPYGFKYFFGYRNFLMKDAHDIVIAYANSIWVNADTDTMKPKAITPEDVAAYSVEPAHDMAYADRKIIVAGTPEELECFHVLESDLDSNQHVNNGSYIRMAQNMLPEGLEIAQMRADYRRSAVLNNLIVPIRYKNDAKYTICLNGQDQKPYTVVEFTTKGNGALHD